MFKVIKEEGTVLNQLKPHIDSPYSPTKDIHFFKKIRVEIFWIRIYSNRENPNSTLDEETIAILVLSRLLT